MFAKWKEIMGPTVVLHGSTIEVTCATMQQAARRLRVQVKSLGCTFRVMGLRSGAPTARKCFDVCVVRRPQWNLRN